MVFEKEKETSSSKNLALKHFEYSFCCLCGEACALECVSHGTADADEVPKGHALSKKEHADNEGFDELISRLS